MYVGFIILNNVVYSLETYDRQNNLILSGAEFQDHSTTRLNLNEATERELHSIRENLQQQMDQVTEQLINLKIKSMDNEK